LVIADGVRLESHCSVVDNVGGVSQNALKKTSQLVDSRWVCSSACGRCLDCWD